MKKKDIIILGAGISGLTAAYHLKSRDFLVIEKSETPGGLCRSEFKNGFTFDKTGHWLHMKNPETKNFFKELFKNDYIKIIREAFIFIDKTFTRYPFQSNTYGLSPQIIKECLLGFIKAKYENFGSLDGKNFHDWCISNFGKGISKYFMIPYNSKLYTVHPRNLPSHWCEKYIPLPSLEEVIEGAVTSPERREGYNAEFFYPRSGGIGELPKHIFNACEKEKFSFSSELISLNPIKKEILLNDGTKIRYNKLISSIPLKTLLSRMEDTKNMKYLSEKMMKASVSYLNVGFNSPLKHGGHWYYIPESKYMPYRVGSFSNIYSELAPKAKASAYIEFTHRKPLDKKKIAEFKKESKKLLIKMELIKSPKQIEFMDYRCIENGYVIFHDDYFSDMEKIHDFTSENSILLVGRYGKWTYSAMEDAILDGIEAAEKLKPDSTDSIVNS